MVLRRYSCTDLLLFVVSATFMLVYALNEHDYRLPRIRTNAVFLDVIIRYRFLAGLHHSLLRQRIRIPNYD
jgi:hypothetical protein